MPEQLLERPLQRPEGMIDARQLIDRQQLEAEAWALLAGREVVPEVEVPHQEFQDNARTALMEALTASGHLSRVEISGSLEEINGQVLSRLVNGWDWSLPAHEKERRFAELCNELLIQAIHRDIVAVRVDADTAILEISDYPEALRGQPLGYRDSNQKGMVRSTHLVRQADGTYTRVIEQVSRSHGTWYSTFGLLAEQGIYADPVAPDIAALQTPVVYSTQHYQDGVVDIMRRLDHFAGPGVLYGDEGVRAARHTPYESLRLESSRREQEIHMYIDDLANLEQQLHLGAQTGRISRNEQVQIFQAEVDRILSAICVLEPEYAEDTFGVAAAGHFQFAADLVARGDTVNAQRVLEQAQQLKETIIFCGMTITVEEAKRAGLTVNSFGDLIEKGKNSWKWKQGVCRVESCPTRPTKTKVGPCSVCARCQAIFDKGDDPTKNKPKSRTLSKA